MNFFYSSFVSSYTPRQAPSRTTSSGSPASSDGGNESIPGESTGTESGSHASSTDSLENDEKHGVVTIAAAVVSIVLFALRHKQAKQRFQLLDIDGHNDACPSESWTTAGLAIIPWFERGLLREEKGHGCQATRMVAIRRRVDMLLLFNENRK